MNKELKAQKKAEKRLTKRLFVRQEDLGNFYHS